MGSCWSIYKRREASEAYSGSSLSGLHHVSEPSYLFASKELDPKAIDQLISDVLNLISSFVDNETESSPYLNKLHLLAEKEDGWLQIVNSIVKSVSIDSPFGPSTITILIDDSPLPSKETVIKLTEMWNLSQKHANDNEFDIKTELNICIVLGCIAEKLVGVNSVAIFTDGVLNYLVTYLFNRRDPSVALFALIALEKFALTMENKNVIKRQLEKDKENPLLDFEQLAYSQNFVWRQVGFCARWALDNLFVIEDRPLSFECVDLSKVNAMLNIQDVSDYLKISPDGLEARSDSHSFESVRGTFAVEEGCYYYEATVHTRGVMQIGWATKDCQFQNHEGYGIGDDMYSVGYDGCRNLLWYKAIPKPMVEAKDWIWRAGDVLGCLIDLDKKEVVFSINGKLLPPFTEIFENADSGFYAAASFMTFQQCGFNFGLTKFSFPPKDRPYKTFNDYGKLTEQEKLVIPKRLFLEELKNTNITEETCTLCFDAVSSCILEPCGHKGFCALCTIQLKECPLCRLPIETVGEDTKEKTD